MKKQEKKINKTKSWFFERVNKIDKPLARLTKKKRERTQISKIRNEKWEISTNTSEKKIREYHDQLYANKFDSLQMDKFLETYSQPKLNQEEVDNLNILITRSEIEFVIKKQKQKLPTNKSPGPDGFSGKFNQTYEDEL